jgi:FMN phosphatase YigB (HAD superfamily)
MKAQPPASAPATPHIRRRPVAAVVFWDFDGTVYRAPAGCRRYGEEISRSLRPADRGEYLARLDQYLSGRGGIGAPDGWEAAAELAAQYSLAAHSPPEGEDERGGEPGNGTSARATSKEGQALGQGRWHEEFRRAREYLEGGACPLEVPAGLPDAISRMRPVSRHVLVTNTPSFGVYGLLQRLGVAGCFDEVVCEAAKPALLPARLSGAAAVYGLEMGAVLCVGDHFGNDVAPALAAGAAGAYINAYGAGPAGAADFEGPVLEAMLPELQGWVAAAAGDPLPALAPVTPPAQGL